MIIRVHDQISIGSEEDCAPGLNLAGIKATIHCCKFPCWRRYSSSNQLPQDHPNYLAFIYPFDLVLNMIDPNLPLFRPETFAMVREFARQHLKRGRQLIIHCNRGESRAPSMAMLIMAKDLGVIGDENYDVARHEFTALYPGFEPGPGIEQYMKEKWTEL